MPGTWRNPPPGFSVTVIEYRWLRPVLTPRGVEILQSRYRPREFHRHVAVAAAMPGPSKVARTSRCAASAAAIAGLTVAPFEVASRNSTVTEDAERFSVVPDLGAMKPPKPYPTVYRTWTAGALLPALSSAPAHVTVWTPTAPGLPPVTETTAPEATPEIASEVRQPAA